MPSAEAPLATSASAEIFPLDGGRVLKLLRPGLGREIATQEFMLASQARALGLPTPQVHEVIVREGRFGLVMDRCEGPTWLALLRQGHADPATLGRAFFELQRRIHQADPSNLLPVQPRLAQRISAAPGVPEVIRIQALRTAQRHGGRRATCHGDFHPMNVIQTAQGPQVIDWTGLGWGDPAIDVNRTMLYLRYGREDLVDPKAREAFSAGYRSACLQAWEHRLAELQTWQMPVAMARLAYDGLGDAERVAVRQLALGEADLWACEALP